MFGKKDDNSENDGIMPEKRSFPLNKTNLIVFIKIITIIAIIVSILYVIRYLSEDEKSKIYLSNNELSSRTEAKNLSSKKRQKNQLYFQYLHCVFL